MKHKAKIVIFLLISIVVLLAIGGTNLVGKASQLVMKTDDQKTTTINTTTNTYLPCVSEGSCKIDAMESPFSIEIAALHQITPTSSLNESEEQFNNWTNQSFPTLVSALKDSGAGWTRIMIRWLDIEPVEGQPLNFIDYDNRLSQISQAGIKMIAIIDKPPDWANDGSVCPRLTPNHEAEYLDFLSEVVGRYRQAPYNIKTWEIFNETDSCFGEGSLYAEILKQSYLEIKAIDPCATVLMGGIAYDWFTEYGGPFYRFFPDKVMLNGGASFFDALNFHYFPDNAPEWERWTPPAIPPICSDPPNMLGTPHAAGGIDVIAKDNYFTSRMSTCFGVNKPVWLTELGAHGEVDNPKSLANQAYYVIEGYARSLAAGIKNITWFALVSPPYDPYQQGLLSNDFSPKPAYYAYQTLVKQLTNYKYVRTLSITGDLGVIVGEGYVFKHSSKGEKIIAWARADQTTFERNRAYLTLAPATSVQVTNYLGNETIIYDGAQGDEDLTHNGSIQIQLTYDALSDETLQLPIPVFISIITP